ncbi:MAG: hypothetical protein MI867_19640 [Pseudomonadales bacterium]|nr:hypothetical protein [Pseudomonadales bacterium]
MKLSQILTLVLLLCSPAIWAVDSVNPTGVNVRANGTTTVFLTFRGVEGEVSTDAFWCGEITVPANTVTNTNPCVPGTLFGKLPTRLDLSRGSVGASGADGNLTDVMTIPNSVARRALQDARAGNSSSFFYIRKFESGGAEQYIAVTCRLAGGGARVPFAITRVEPAFKTNQGRVPVYLASIGEVLPKVQVELDYNGSGRLKGRWELVTPGDVGPSSSDLLSEASLPIEQRGLQKRYTVIERFDVFLPPTGRTIIEGPDPKLLTQKVIGPYQLLMRIEATRDKEGNSDIGTGVVASGGVAGFPIPPLRFYVDTDENVSKAKRDSGVEGSIFLLTPKDGKVAESSSVLHFRWVHQSNGRQNYSRQNSAQPKQADLYVVDIKLANGETYEAIKHHYQYEYIAPPWVLEALREVKNGQWRVTALNSQGQRVARSDWQAVEMSQ